MKVKQVYDIVNFMTKELLGETDLTVAEDLSNVVTVGEAIFNATEVDNYVRTLVDHIGKVIFVNRVYRGTVPSVIKDGWEYGSVVQKIRATLPEATENESWELQAGTSYDMDIFTPPTVVNKFFNSKVTFEIPVSFTDKQVKESFDNAQQLNAFYSMITNEVNKSMDIKLNQLAKRTINNAIAETLHAEYPLNNFTEQSGVKAVNVLKLYNDDKGTALTADKCITDADFLRFASVTMRKYVKRLSEISTLFNIGGTEKYTPTDYLHVVLLDDFMAGAEGYLQSDTYHKELVALPKADSVPYWQGSGKTYAFKDISKINVKTASDGQPIEISGVLGVMFDRDACGVSNLDLRVKTHYNEKGEFTNNWYKMDAGYFNDLDENCVVFFVA